MSTVDRLGVMVTLGQLWARRELALEIAVDPVGARSREVTIVHSSELPEVDEWLAGGEVLLTIGVGQDLTADSAGDYIARLKRVGVHALGIGLGRDLPSVELPPSLVDHARAHDLALFGVPEPVPFVAVVDAFTRMREEESNREVSRAGSAGRRFATALARQGPAALVAELSAALGSEVHFVSPTGRGLTGQNAPADVRAELIAEAVGTSLAPRLLRAAGGRYEAVPIGDDRVSGWILAGRDAAVASRTRGLLLATAAALLGLSVIDQPLSRGESTLFSTTLSASEARAEWVLRTGTPALSRAEFTIVGGVRGDGAEQLFGDLGGGTLTARAGSMIGVLHSGDPLVARVAEVTGVDRLFVKSLPLTQVHHTWTVWRTQNDTVNSDVRALLSVIDEAAAVRFVEEVLGALLASQDGQDLLVTLRSFIASGGVRDAVAAELGIHRHTVRARLQRIERLLGRDLSRPDTVHAVAIALELAEL